MNIGLVIENFDPARGGVEQWTWQFANHMTTRGHRIHVLARSFGPQVLASAIVPHRVEGGSSRMKFAADVAERLGALDLDVVHDTGCGWRCDVFQPHGGSRAAATERNLALAAGWLRPIKRWAGRSLPRYREFNRLNARQYGDAGRIYVAISRMVARDLTQFHGVRPEQVRLVYNGVDVERFSPERRAEHRTAMRTRLAVADDEVLLLIVAHNFLLKGVPTLLRAVARLAGGGQRVRLAVVGGKRIEAWRRWTARLGIAERVAWLGSIDDPVACYAAADVYVQPTYYDPCSLVVLEALASGLPVVTSRFNGAGELITAGREGAVVDDPGDDEGLARALVPLCDERERQAMGRAARELALQHSLERNCREIAAVYDEVIARRASISASQVRPAA